MLKHNVLTISTDQIDNNSIEILEEGTVDTINTDVLITPPNDNDIDLSELLNDNNEVDPQVLFNCDSPIDDNIALLFENDENNNSSKAPNGNPLSNLNFQQFNHKLFNNVIDQFEKRLANAKSTNQAASSSGKGQTVTPISLFCSSSNSTRSILKQYEHALAKQSAKDIRVLWTEHAAILSEAISVSPAKDLEKINIDAFNAAPRKPSKYLFMHITAVKNINALVKMRNDLISLPSTKKVTTTIDFIDTCLSKLNNSNVITIVNTPESDVVTSFLLSFKEREKNHPSLENFKQNDDLRNELLSNDNIAKFITKSTISTVVSPIDKIYMLDIATAKVVELMQGEQTKVIAERILEELIHQLNTIRSNTNQLEYSSYEERLQRKLFIKMIKAISNGNHILLKNLHRDDYVELDNCMFHNENPSKKRARVESQSFIVNKHPRIYPNDNGTFFKSRGSNNQKSSARKSDHILDLSSVNYNDENLRKLTEEGFNTADSLWNESVNNQFQFIGLEVEAPSNDNFFDQSSSTENDQPSPYLNHRNKC